MRARHALPLISVIALTLLPSFGYGQTYSWKDANGKIHYGDRPPAEKKADIRKLTPAPMATDDVEAARKANADRQLDDREKQGKAQEGTKKPPEDPAQAKQLESLKALEQARAAEEAARKSGDMAKLKEAQEAARRAENEAKKQAELAKQREAAAQDARKKAEDASKSAQRAEVKMAAPKAEVAVASAPAAVEVKSEEPKAEAPKASHTA